MEQRYGMREYNIANYKLAISNEGKDPVTFEYLETVNEKPHPRKTINIRRKNGKPYPYNISTIINIIELGDGKDPFTRELFPAVVIEKAYLYQRCIELFPNYTIDSLNTTKLFEKWLSSYLKEDITESDLEMVNIEAKCFLLIEDLVTIFKTYYGKASMNNRKLAEKELKNKPVGFWILRNSSLQDSQYNKAYVLTIKIDNDKYRHLPIVHKIGEGICFNCKMKRGGSVDRPFIYEKIYPTIIDLLEDTVMNCYSNYCHNDNIDNIQLYLLNTPISTVPKIQIHSILSCTA